MRKCKHCSKDKQARIQRQSHTPDYHIASEYGLARLVTSQQIIMCNDEYMLEILFKTQKKTKKLDKQVAKIKSQIKHLQRSVEHARHSRKKSKNSQSDDDAHGQGLLRSTEKAKSRMSSVNESKNREIGRFTRVSQGESHSFQKNSLKQIFPSSIITESTVNKKKQKLSSRGKSKNEQKSDTVSFSRFSSNHYMINSSRSGNNLIKQKTSKQKSPKNDKKLKEDDCDLLKYTKGSQISSLNYSTNQKESEKKETILSGASNTVDLFMPSYQQVDSSISSNLLSNDDSINAGDRKARLQREFQELIVLEKNVNQEEKKVIRSEIKALSQMLSNMKE